MGGEDKLTRIAIVNDDKCKPKKCRQECKKSCPVVRTGKLCIEVSPESKIAFISERLCIGCGICPKKCPFDAINIINLPTNLETQISHRYSANSFKLHRLPLPRPNEVLGLVGTNGIGKSTALNILSGKLKPNLGRYEKPPNYADILKHYKGSELHNFFTRVLEDDIESVTKPQYVDTIPKGLTGSEREVGQNLVKKAPYNKQTQAKILGKLRTIYGSESKKTTLEERIKVFEDFRSEYVPIVADNAPESRKKEVASKSWYFNQLEQIIEELELGHIFDRDVDKLSGGELQRFAIGIAAASDVDVIMIDEPSSFLDVKQRLAAGRIIQKLAKPGEAKNVVMKPRYVIVVEHDLSVLDYMSDYICVLYGVPSVYGVVSFPASVREGINNFLDGTIPSENLRFRQESLQFRIADAGEEFIVDKTGDYAYPSMTKTQGNFKLSIKKGSFTNSEIMVMMGENGTGKTTFCKMLAGVLEPDNGKKVPKMNVSMKPQIITPKFKGTVRQLLMKLIKGSFLNPQFQTDVYKPMKIEDIIDQEVQLLSGGELQRVAIVIALGKPADVYIIDEPSAYLDSEQRIIASRVIKRFIMHAKKTAFVVEHDFIMATYLADRVIVFEGTPGIDAHANPPESLLTGCNRFLSNLEVTFRRDPVTYRPRINKLNSQMDQEQKRSKQYYFLEEES